MKEIQFSHEARCGSLRVDGVNCSGEQLADSILGLRSYKFDMGFPGTSNRCTAYATVLNQCTVILHVSNFGEKTPSDRSNYYTVLPSFLGKVVSASPYYQMVQTIDDGHNKVGSDSPYSNWGFATVGEDENGDTCLRVFAGWYVKDNGINADQAKAVSDADTSVQVLSGIIAGAASFIGIPGMSLLGTIGSAVTDSLTGAQGKVFRNTFNGGETNGWQSFTIIYPITPIDSMIQHDKTI